MQDTKPEKVEALAEHFEAVPTRSELVAVTYRDDEAVNAVVAVDLCDLPCTRADRSHGRAPASKIAFLRTGSDRLLGTTMHW